MPRPLLLLAPLLAAVVLSAGCGDDDDAVGASSTTSAGVADDDTVTVVAEDISFPEDTYTAGAGTVTVRYENAGTIRHTLMIEEVDGLDLEVDSTGDVDEASIDLEAGTYTLFCDVPGHRAAGMVADLVIG